METVRYYKRINNRGRLVDYAEFDGIEFYKHQKYYSNNKYGNLHVYIYQYYNPDVNIEGHDIHHKDHNPLNNDISNLQLLTRSDHIKLHDMGENNPMYGKIGEKNPMWITITDEMINDYKNGIRRKDFLIKYNVSQKIWDKIRK